MTVSFEQLKALKVGRHTLAIIVDDEELFGAARECAQRLLDLYPREEQLDAAGSAEPEPLRRWAVALSATATLFAILADWEQGSDPTKQALHSTLKHFPGSALLGVLCGEPEDDRKWSLLGMTRVVPSGKTTSTRAGQ